LLNASSGPSSNVEIQLGTGKKMEWLKAKPEVGRNVPESILVVAPAQVPVKAVSNVLVEDDPAEHRLDQNRCCLVRN